eukprot:s1967_g4.t1
MLHGDAPLACRRAEASCSDAIRQARVTRVRAKGLKKLAKVKLKRSEEGAHHVFKQFGQSLDVKISKTDLPTKKNFPYVAFTDWLRYLVECDNLEYLVGVSEVAEMKPILRTFWARYTALYPQHVVSQRAATDADFSVEMCIPVLYHGDEGRGLKKKQLMVLSTHGMLGKKSTVSDMKLNMEGHSFLNHFLQCVLPISLYGDDPSALHHMLDLQAKEFASLFQKGVTLKGMHFYICCVGVKGDAPWIAKSGLFHRTFSRRPTKATAKKPCVGICHLCNAGREDLEVDLPFEEYGTVAPAWLPTVGQDRPYAESEPSPLLQIPMGIHGTDETLWHFDLFHNFHSGMGKYFASSAICVVMEILDLTIDESFDYLTQDFKQFCQKNKESPYHKKITKSLLGVEGGFRECPDGSWSKGDFTRLILKWFGDYCSRCVAEAVFAINACLSGLYRSGLFIPSERAERLARQGLQFLRLYSELAGLCFSRKMRRFPLAPKGHYMHHQMLTLLFQSQNCEWALNILSMSVQMEEDYIGQDMSIQVLRQDVEPRRGGKSG